MCTFHLYGAAQRENELFYNHENTYFKSTCAEKQAVITSDSL